MAESQPHTIAVIPARAGSKRLPGKNLLPLGGHPLIAWSIRQALECPGIQEVYLSTDDPAMAEVGQRYGAQVIHRPPELATDTASTLEVLKHAVGHIEQNGPRIDLLVLLQPTSPFREAKVLDEALERMVRGQADALVSVSKVHLGPNWMLEIRQNQLEFAFGRDFSAVRSQDQPPLYQPNGALYVYTRNNLLQAQHYAWGDKVLPLVLDSPYDHDIDTEADFKFAEALLHAYDLHW